MINKYTLAHFFHYRSVVCRWHSIGLFNYSITKFISLTNEKENKYERDTKRTAIGVASGFLAIIGLLAGIVFAFAMLITGGTTNVGYSIGGLIGGVLIWANFAVWGELLEVFQTIEATQIEILNHLKEGE